MKELYYYSEAHYEELQVCQVIKETPKTYVVYRGFECTIRKEIMRTYDYKTTYFFETRERAEKSHLCFLNAHARELRQEAKYTLDRALECEALIKKLYGDKKGD